MLTPTPASGGEEASRSRVPPTVLIVPTVLIIALIVLIVLIIVQYS